MLVVQAKLEHLFILWLKIIFQTAPLLFQKKKDISPQKPDWLTQSNILH